MATKTGRITKIYDKTFDDGGRSVSFRIAGDEKFYRAGKKRFAGILEEGATVEFEYKPISDTAAQVVGSPTLSSKKAAGGGGSSERSSGGDTTAHHIHYQSSRKDAIELVGLLVSQGAIKLGAKESAKAAVIEKAVDHYTAAFYADIETKGAVARVKGPEADDAEAESEADDAEEGDDD